MVLVRETLLVEMGVFISQVIVQTCTVLAMCARVRDMFANILHDAASCKLEMLWTAFRLSLAQPGVFCSSKNRLRHE